MSANPTYGMATPNTARRRNRPTPLVKMVADPANRVNTMLELSLFRSILTLERKRAERSRKPFALMLIHASELLKGGGEKTRRRIVSALARSTRETDVIGWYEEGSILGVIFTEIDLRDEAAILPTLRDRVAACIEEEALSSARVSITIHVFPEEIGQDSSGNVADATLYPEISSERTSQRAGHIVKRFMDALISAFLLVALVPVFAAIAIAIKLSSRGPVFFRQERLGRLGIPFQCLKFRTMQVNNSPTVHQEFVQDFIKGKDPKATGAEQPVFKITNDPRVTGIGRLLRRTSLDELPQLLNVLVGDMSLVGPRPPVRYEYRMYDVWHRSRVLEVRPGMTGLWQVSGRSRTRFDEMVRLDLRYCRSWSLWLDLVILLRTPRAVFSGGGAY